MTDCHYTIINLLIHQEDLTIIINLYTEHWCAWIHEKILIDLKWETYSNKIIVSDINTLLSIINTLSRQKYNNETTVQIAL